MGETNRAALRHRRQMRVRQRVQGSSARPRLNVFRSLKHIYAQVIDDARGHTLAAASTLDAEVKARRGGLSKAEQARLVGETVGKRALAQGVKQVVFDRSGYKYHGLVKSLADGARASGLEF